MLSQVSKLPSTKPPFHFFGRPAQQIFTFTNLQITRLSVSLSELLPSFRRSRLAFISRGADPSVSRSPLRDEVTDLCHRALFLPTASLLACANAPDGQRPGAGRPPHRPEHIRALFAVVPNFRSIRFNCLILFPNLSNEAGFNLIGPPLQAPSERIIQCISTCPRLISCCALPVRVTSWLHYRIMLTYYQVLFVRRTVEADCRCLVFLLTISPPIRHPLTASLHNKF